MATRSGSVDPGVLLWLVGQGHLSADEVLDGIDREGGLLALAGTKDMREVLERSLPATRGRCSRSTSTCTAWSPGSPP